MVIDEIRKKQYACLGNLEWLHWLLLLLLLDFVLLECYCIVRLVQSISVLCSIAVVALVVDVVVNHHGMGFVLHVSRM